MVDTDAVEPPTPDFSGLPSMISPVKSPPRKLDEKHHPVDLFPGTDRRGNACPNGSPAENAEVFSDPESGY
jgi:hypothetical protein